MSNAFFRTSILVYSFSDNTWVYGIVVKWSMNYKYDTDDYIRSKQNYLFLHHLPSDLHLPFAKVLQNEIENKK